MADIRKKIKVLHIYRSMNRGGAETFIMNVFRRINREKFQFDFLCTSSENGAYDSEIHELGGNIYHYEKFNQKNLYKVIKDTIRIIEEKGPFDAIHIPLQFFSAFFCIAAKICGIKKIIVHSHSASDDGGKNFLRTMYLNIARRIINKYATHKLSCGELAGEFLFGSLENVKIVYNGIDLEKFKNVGPGEVNKLKELYNLKDEMIIGHVGRFAEVKNQQFFINIAKELIRSRINFKIVLVGDGSKFLEIKDLVQKNNLDEYFVFAGSQADMPAFFSSFDVLVMPSFYEGYPITIVEALASGVPCILSDSITKEVNLIDNACTFINLNESIDIWCSEIIKKASYKFDKKQNCKILSRSGLSIEHTVNQLSKIYEGRK